MWYFYTNRDGIPDTVVGFRWAVERRTAGREPQRSGPAGRPRESTGTWHMDPNGVADLNYAFGGVGDVPLAGTSTGTGWRIL